MTRSRWLLLLASLTLLPADVGAQGLLWPGPIGSGGIVAGGGFNSSRRGSLRIGVGFAGGRFGGYSPFSPFCGPCGPFGYRRVNVLSITTISQPPVIIVPPPQFLDPQPQPDDDVPPVPFLPPRDPIPMPGPPPRKEAPKPPPPPPPKKEEPKKDDEDLAKLVRPPAAEDDPRDEYDRQVRLGREAFLLGEYGRAVLRFRQASRVLPEPPLAYFLLAQSLLALGKYHEAHDSIVGGLARAPDWPESRFRPVELYGDGVAEYAGHLLRLERALERHPRDPVLLFLYGYQLWFDGRKDEAGEFFRRALADTAARDAVERFIRALPAGARL